LGIRHPMLRLKQFRFKIPNTRYQIPNTMAKAINTYITYKNEPILVKIYTEKRKGTRFAIGNKYAVIRFQNGLSKAQKEEQFEKFSQWVFKAMDENPSLQDRFIGKIYEDGSTLNILDKVYTVRFMHQNRKTIKAKVVDKNIILIEFDRTVDYPLLQKDIRQLVSRVVAFDNQKEIERKVDFYNDTYFQETINGISLKLNQSNWGSCSNNRNLNFSTRLLFAPDDVIDYIIIHELAHLKEFNHSPRFWKIVSDIMPNYKSKELWLKENSHLCQF
jgi:predicted metal-dependent hydrolase